MGYILGMTVLAYRLEALAWLFASVYLLERRGLAVASLVFFIALVKAFSYEVTGLLRDRGR